MPYATINRQEVIELFHQLMRPDSEFCVVHLLGDAKLGKSHFMTKIFPALARRDYNARCAVLDLRSAAQDIADVLHMAHDILGGDPAFPNYCAAYQEWINRP